MKSAMLWLLLVVVALMSVSADNGSTNTDVAEATSVFTLNIMKQIFSSETGNVIMSPLSVSTLLAMLQQGARNNSLTQLATVLHLSPDSSKNYGNVIQNFSKRKFKSKLEFGSKIFVNNDFDLNAKYSSVLHTAFHASAETVNFADPSRAAERVNEWVSYASKNRITEILKPNTISGRTQMVLANVIYFKGIWQKTFDEAETLSEDFHTTPTKTVKVQMMNINALFRSGEDEKLNAVWVELPYDGNDFSMIVVLPIVKHGLAQVIQKLTPTDFNNMMNTRITKDVRLKLPRFKISATVPIVPALQKLGLSDVFDQRSNLEGISVSKGPLVVSEIIHKAEIEVNEAGSEASGASAIGVNTLSLQPDYDEVTFFADQPFLVVIVDRVNSMPIFVARVNNPIAA